MLWNEKLGRGMVCFGPKEKQLCSAKQDYMMASRSGSATQITCVCEYLTSVNSISAFPVELPDSLMLFEAVFQHFHLLYCLHDQKETRNFSHKQRTFRLATPNIKQSRQNLLLLCWFSVTQNTDCALRCHAWSLRFCEMRWTPPLHDPRFIQLQLYIGGITRK